jgi:GT2 family glycosyltransferase
LKKVDVIILSYAKNHAMQSVTEKALATLFASEDQQKVSFNTVVIDSNKSLNPSTYPGTTTLYPNGSFNFNKYLNIGVNHTDAEYICFCNNDLIFYPGWASAMLDTFKKDNELISVSPFCSIYHPTVGFQTNTGVHYGYKVRDQVAGWCFMVKRPIFDKIGLFDEQFKFWFADADYAQTLQQHHIKHALVTNARVDHLDGVSTAELTSKEKLALTSEQFWYFQYKWVHRNYPLYIYRLLRSKLRIANKGQ